MQAGDIVRVDFGIPQGSEPGFVRPAVVVTADQVLAAQPRTLHVVPITSNVTRGLPTEIRIDANVGGVTGMAQVHLCSVISRSRITDDETSPNNVGAASLAQIRSVLSDLLDLP